MLVKLPGLFLYSLQGSIDAKITENALMFHRVMEALLGRDQWRSCGPGSGTKQT